MVTEPPSSDARRSTLVIVPAYNEEACVADVVASVRAERFDCLVIDDGSRDATGARAAAAGAIVVRHPINLGVGGALRTGFRYAVAHGYSSVVQVDADGQHTASDIVDLLAALDGDSALEATDRLDMVIGSRFADGSEPNMSWTRRRCITLLAFIVRRFGKANITDPTSGFRAIRSPLLEAFAGDFPHHYLGDTFEAVLVAARRGYRIAEIPVVMRQRQGGTPSADRYASFQAMVRACTVMLTGTTFDLPYRPGGASAPLPHDA